MTTFQTAQFQLNSLSREITAKGPGIFSRNGRGLHVWQFFASTDRGVLASLGLTWLELFGVSCLTSVKPQPCSLVENPLATLACELRQDFCPGLPSLTTALFTVCHLVWNEIQSRQFGLDQLFEPSGLSCSLNPFDHIIFIQTNRSQGHQPFTKSINGQLLLGKHCFEQTF